MNPGSAGGTTRGAGRGGSLLLGCDPPVCLLELLLLDPAEEAEQLEARHRFGHTFDSRPVAAGGAGRVS
jgi:hypothetical protein